MALEEYQRKRDFRKTPEPAGLRRPRRKAAAVLGFVVQKHAARRLHYDFRLEHNGVLLSWAIPKGPSLDPGEKRLAVRVEDHPLEYGSFEGVIPQGQYGGGTVLLWDRGVWTPEEPDVDAALKKGALKFRLDGEKLHGKWALVRMGGKAAAEARENWLLIKERDEEAAPGSDSALVDRNPLSVATGRSMEAIAADRDRVWDSEKGEVAGDPTAAPAKKPFVDRPPGARRRKMPDTVQLQLATLAPAPPEGEGWLHEIKYDGYRLLARIEHGAVRLSTRKGLDWTDKFPALARALATLPVDTALLDGEIVALAADGRTSFAELQEALSRHDTDDLVLYVFDLLYRDGYDLTPAALADRKSVLAEIVPREAHGAVRYSDHQQGRGPAVFRRICEYKLEGIVSKRADRPYRPGRSTDWLKVKCHNEDEFIIVGFTEPGGQRHGFGALLLGYYDPRGALVYAGRVGTGFSEALLDELYRRLVALERRDSPAVLPRGLARKGVHWVEPRLVAQIRYGERTADGLLRHPAFLGLREDKEPRDVVYDPGKPGAAVTGADPCPADAGAGSSPGAAATLRAPAGGGGSGSRAGDGGRGRGAPAQGVLPKITRARDGSVDFAGVRLTHPERVLYPDAGITKLALAMYYDAVKDWALPHLAHRALSLVRCPAGYTHQCFYQKHATAGVPDVVGRVRITEKSSTDTYLVIENAAGLIAMAQLSMLEIHPWGSTVDKIETPDRVTFDFDPDEGLPWARVTSAAIELREALLGIGLRSFAKTTGGKGLHVVVPLAPKLGWDAVKAFAKWVAERFAAAYPERFTTNMAKRARRGRIYIDYLRNGRGATAIGAYSTRARAGAPVATPLFWEEVERGVTPDRFTLASVPARLAGLEADPWAEMPRLRQTISARVRRELGI
jgi:bifunctional non-homologous end joining protein LigD